MRQIEKRIDDILEDYFHKKIDLLEVRKQLFILWNECGETKIINDPENFIECNTTECCGIGPIVNENYCPNCGRKIVRK